MSNAPSSELYRAQWKEIHASALTPGMHVRYRDRSGSVDEGVVDTLPTKQPGSNGPWLCKLRINDDPHTRLKQLFLDHELEVAEFYKVTM